jgi:hypothetical protein
MIGLLLLMSHSAPLLLDLLGGTLLLKSFSRHSLQVLHIEKEAQGEIKFNKIITMVTKINK